MSVFLVENMENDSLITIQKAEEKAEKKIAEVKKELEVKKEGRISFWQKEEDKIKEEFYSKKENLTKELEGDFNEIKKEIDSATLVKEKGLKEISEKRFRIFFQELEKKIYEHSGSEN